MGEARLSDVPTNQDIKEAVVSRLLEADSCQLLEMIYLYEEPRLSKIFKHIAYLNSTEQQRLLSFLKQLNLSGKAELRLKDGCLRIVPRQ